MKKGLFITFEGPEGGGKSTQIRRTAAFLKKKGRKVSVFREPGGTRAGEAIRTVLLDRGQKKITAGTELLLYLAARAQLTAEKILPALKRGEMVICDRFEDSTLAYQGYGRGLPLEAIRRVSETFVRGRLRPDVTIVLDIDPMQGMARGGRRDRMEKESIRFHRKVRNGFLALAKKGAKRYVVIDASQDKQTVFEAIKRALKHATG